MLQSGSTQLKDNLEKKMLALPRQLRDRGGWHHGGREALVGTQPCYDSACCCFPCMTFPALAICHFLLLLPSEATQNKADSRMRRGHWHHAIRCLQHLVAPQTVTARCGGRLKSKSNWSSTGKLWHGAAPSSNASVSSHKETLLWRGRFARQKGGMACQSHGLSRAIVQSLA